MKHKMMYLLISGLLILAFIIGCTATNPTLKLTFNDAGDKCTYKGPKTFSYGTFTLQVVQGQNPVGTIGYGIVTLDEGKTFDDLDAWPSVTPPDWLTVLDDHGPLTQDTSFPYDLNKMSNYAQGASLYLVCMSQAKGGPVLKVGTIGPINVKQ